MRTQEPIDWQLINYHLQELPRAFNTRRTKLEGLTVQLLDLKETHCTGNEHWRDTDNEGRKPKLYVIHSINTGCPLHGQPKPGKRIRTYIGSKPGKIETAIAAIARGQLFKEVTTKTENTHTRILSAHHTLRRIFWMLELDAPLLPSETTAEEAQTP